MLQSFYRLELFEGTYSICTFQFLCNKCPFKGSTQGYLDKHIFWIFEGKVPQCELCHYMPTSKAAMAKQIEFLHDMDN